MIDLLCSLGLGVLVLLVAVAYAYRLLRTGPARDARIEQAGRSPLLPTWSMEMGYWALRRVARGCVAIGASANAITWTSLVLAVFAGLALASGHFGVGATLIMLSFACDAVDGLVARTTGAASDSGEVFDAAVDRYAELFTLGGVAFFERLDPPLLVLALSAIAGSMMVSYSTAKAQSFGVSARGNAMRRPERAVVFVLGTGLVPAMAFARDRWGLPGEWVTAPLVASLGVLGVVGNLSALRRLYSIAEAVSRSRPPEHRSQRGPRASATDVRAAGDRLL